MNDDRKPNFIHAAMQGVEQMVSQYEAKVTVQDDGFIVAFPNGDRLFFSVFLELAE